ncbi:hypothetical protein Desru_2050 [Desulforamulus ruminis DSM 2154]|uniref:Uncharacterized protein n=1 Tax=Desulforamulus ruminis (strain ATCC 23193 / DSM 2154 / NCIMB 8452 / DL) TaxID=696281 RepID=F6DVF0_DESRL|nr:hypothetical protein Desru_2050 [Desulforamulus ruminis DSM 2154]
MAWLCGQFLTTPNKVFFLHKSTPKIFEFLYICIMKNIQKNITYEILILGLG